MTDAEFNICVEKYMKMVYRIAFHYFGRREDAENITQDRNGCGHVIARKISNSCLSVLLRGLYM